MHESIEQLMGLTFYTHEAMIAVVFINLGYWLLRPFKPEHAPMGAK
jgi:hypothetical protein